MVPVASHFDAFGVSFMADANLGNKKGHTGKKRLHNAEEEKNRSTEA